MAASGLVSPAIALLLGLIYGLTLTHPFPVESSQLTKFLLQTSVVALGFGMNLHEVLQAGRSGFVYTALSITAAMLLGLGLGYAIDVRKKSSFLISAGTAICGGSAIAAVGPIVGATDEEMAVSLGAAHAGMDFSQSLLWGGNLVYFGALAGWLVADAFRAL